MKGKITVKSTKNLLHKGLIYSDQVRAKFKEYPSSYISKKIAFLSPSTNVASVNEAIRDERVKAEADFLSFTKISFDNYQLKIKELAGWEKYIYCCPWALFSLIALGVLFNFSFWGFIGLIFWAFIANFSANFLAKMVSTKIKENTIENFLDSMQT